MAEWIRAANRSSSDRSRLAPSPSGKRRGSPKRTFTLPGLGNRAPVGNDSKAPWIEQGITGARERAASKAAPPLASRSVPSSLRPPSGKRPTTCPRLSLASACLMALGPASAVRTGMVCIPQ